MIKIQKIQPEDIESILDLADVIFKGQLADNKSYIKSATNWDISVKLTKDGEIIGFYLFNDRNIPLNDIKVRNKKGIEGVALGVDAKYRNNGYGKELINYSLRKFNKNYDYIWGEHLETLGNKVDWMKRREIIRQFKHLFMTIKFFDK